MTRSEFGVELVEFVDLVGLGLRCGHPFLHRGQVHDALAVGQTVAAQDLCPNIRPYRKTHHIQTGVGHYGVFSGRKWNQQIYPLVREHIHASHG